MGRMAWSAILVPCLQSIHVLMHQLTAISRPAHAKGCCQACQETQYAIFPVPYVEESLGMPLSNGKARADCFERQRRLVIPLLHAADDAV